MCPCDPADEYTSTPSVVIAVEISTHYFPV